MYQYKQKTKDAIVEHLKRVQFASAKQIAQECKINWRTAKRYLEHLETTDKHVKALLAGRIKVYMYSTLKHRQAALQRFVYVEYYDHATLKGAPGYKLPPELGVIGAVVEENDQYLIVKSLWSNTLDGMSLTRHLILKSAIKTIREVKLQ